MKNIELDEYKKELELLIKFWQKLDLTNQIDFIHENDRSFFQQKRIKVIDYKIIDYESAILDYLNNPLYQNNKLSGVFNTNILPGPYVGDLRNAKIFFLLLNPGFDYTTYYESLNTDVRKECINTIHQNNLDNDYPFYLLNPKYLWTSGGKYWNGKFHNLIKEISLKYEKPYIETLKMFARNTAAIELVPYPSKNLNVSEGIIKSLESSKLVINFVEKLSQREEVLIVVMRQKEKWKMANIKAKVITFGSKEAQKASLNPHTNVGKKVMCEIISMLENKIIDY